MAILYPYRLSNLIMEISYPYRLLRLNPKSLCLAKKVLTEHGNFLSLQVFETKFKIIVFGLKSPYRAPN